MFMKICPAGKVMRKRPNQKSLRLLPDLSQKSQKSQTDGKSGSICRVERDLMGRTDRFGVEVRERTMWDIRQGVVGADTFVPKHVVIATWKNVSFAGGIDNSLYTVSGLI